MKKLLVPIDGSNASINATKKAIELAKDQKYSIKLISVVNSEYFNYQDNENTWKYFNDAILPDLEELNRNTEKKVEQAKNLLSSIIDRLDFAGINVQHEVLHGEPYEKIIETAKNGNFDMIVMGNRGFSKIKRFFVGSVTQRVISDAPCPVLVIHSNYEC